MNSAPIRVVLNGRQYSCWPWGSITVTVQRKQGLSSREIPSDGPTAKKIRATETYKQGLITHEWDSH